jgi:hypothetical protein
MVSPSPSLTSPDQPRVISEVPSLAVPCSSPDIALPNIRVAPKKLILDFAASPNQYKAAASRKNQNAAKGRQPRSKQNPRQVLSLSLKCETVQTQDPELE